MIYMYSEFIYKFSIFSINYNCLKSYTVFYFLKSGYFDVSENILHYLFLFFKITT